MNLEDMKGAVVLLGLVALIGAAVGIALDDFKDDIASDATATTFNNLTKTIANGTTAVFAECVENVALNSVTLYSNASAGALPIAAGNYTITGNTLALALDTTAVIGAGAASKNVSFSCGTRGSAYNTTISGLDGVSNSTGYLDTIGTIIGVAVLIGIVVLAFTFARR